VEEKKNRHATEHREEMKRRDKGKRKKQKLPFSKRKGVDLWEMKTKRGKPKRN